jgi:hypothetical protein
MGKLEKKKSDGKYEPDGKNNKKIVKFILS